LINDDIDAIIQRGEERTVELNSKYEGLNLEDLSNFKSEASVQQWEGEDFRTGVSFAEHRDFISAQSRLATQTSELQSPFAVKAGAQIELLG
jgi:SWI/SNF-related matrix-associated actin-dependent regulator of chromatin subfamily A member 5